MKTARKVIGIISVVLFLIITFQSCAAGVYNTMADTGEVSGSAGFIPALLMLLAGIIGITVKESSGAIIAATVFYALGGIIGFLNMGSFGDLTIWSGLSIIFAIVYALSFPSDKKDDSNINNDTNK